MGSLIKTAVKYGGSFVFGTGVGAGASNAKEISKTANYAKLAVLGAVVYLIVKKINK